MTTRQEPARSGFAVGVTGAAGVLLIIGGVCHGFQGLVALFNDEFYVTTQNYIFKFDVTTWGWIHLLIGVVAVFAGAGLFSGKVWARTVAVLIAALSIVLNFAWLPYYPLWSILIIAFDIFVIWAVTAHGRDITRDA